MRPGYLPDQEDVGLNSMARPDFLRARRRAVRAVELLIGQHIEPSIRQVIFRPQFGWNLLPEFPFRNPTLDGNKLDSDGEVGLVRLELAPGEYTINYEVGYRPGEIPSVYRRLIEMFIEWQIRPEVVDRHLMTETIRAARWTRQKTERAAYAAH